ncbi:Cystathionine gamma-synthase [Thecaphora frezii]
MPSLPLPPTPAAPAALPSKRDFAVGTSIPANLPHAVSVSLPLWQDNVDYEEGRLSQSMETGYPRFFIHRSIQRLVAHLIKKFAKPHEQCILLPSEAVANRCRDFVRAQHAKLPTASVDAPLPVRIVRFSIVDQVTPGDGSSSSAVASSSDPRTHYIFIVFFPADAFPIAKSYWQHTGEGISSRQAERCLQLLEQSGSLEDDVSVTLSSPAATTAAGGDISFAQQQQQQAAAQHHDATAEVGKGGKRFYNRYARNGSISGTPANTAPSPSSSGILPPKQISSSSISTAPVATAVDVDDEKLASDLTTYVEERYGRNLPKGSAAQAKQALRRRIAGTLLSDRGEPEGAEAAPSNATGETSRTGTGVTEEHVYLYPTGMASIFHAHQLAMHAQTLDDPDAAVGKSVCFGFPYTDTLKILQKWGPGCHFYGNGLDTDLDELEKLLEAQRDGTAGEAPMLALFCEFPSNPLLRSPDLVRIRSLADRYGFVVVVDETIGNFVNVEVLPYADVLVSSLTKVFSGDANVMGGSLVLNPHSKHFARLQRALQQRYEDLFFDEDALFLERNSRDFVKRIVQIDENTRALTEMLWRLKEQGAAIKMIYYPRFVARHNYEKCRRKRAFLPGAEMGSGDEERGGGYGGLFSITFHRIEASRAFYDSLRCAKGPSLGTNYTLASPYTILAHYTELDWAQRYGVESGLVRISVGLEDKDELLDMFRSSIEQAEKAMAEAQA